MAKNNLLKSIVVVFGAMSFEWLAIGLVFKPLLDKTRASMDKSWKHLATSLPQPPIKVQKLASLRSILILPKKQLI
ncbi:hypothetical protein H5410_032190 [Solanum commersonii]|uniref:Uncharacterized protein n=1 Tax=Solanum commersonii TaxID=4109 RepID=A0A9J5YNY0_SOLCO|nr:hypothetical protein H5410_032190 [Solanum commersonii]